MVRAWPLSLFSRHVLFFSFHIVTRSSLIFYIRSHMWPGRLTLTSRSPPASLARVDLVRPWRSCSHSSCHLFSPRRLGTMTSHIHPFLIYLMLKKNISLLSSFFPWRRPLLAVLNYFLPPCVHIPTYVEYYRVLTNCVFSFSFCEKTFISSFFLFS